MATGTQEDSGVHLRGVHQPHQWNLSDKWPCTDSESSNADHTHQYRQGNKAYYAGIFWTEKYRRLYWRRPGNPGVFWRKGMCDRHLSASEYPWTSGNIHGKLWKAGGNFIFSDQFYRKERILLSAPCKAVGILEPRKRRWKKKFPLWGIRTDYFLPKGKAVLVPYLDTLQKDLLARDWHSLCFPI